MGSVSTILLDKEILLESGTNELELLVFEVAGYWFGINVAKVREVLPAQKITKLPRAHRSIRGVFKLRDQVIPCVSLLSHLGIASTAPEPESTLILADLNQQQTAFLVDAVDRIYRLSWKEILAVPGLEALAHAPVTALARCEGRLVLLLDFEMILDDVTEHFFRIAEVGNPLGLPRGELRILLAEDSPTVRDAIGSTLRASGYTQLGFFDNGAAAWSWIEERLAETGCVQDVADLVISDVEMPQVDGFHLTKRIKQHPQLARLPVLLYSSIVTPDNQKKGRAVGADAQVAKPELDKVVELADELIAAARHRLDPSATEAWPSGSLPSDAVPDWPPQSAPASPAGSDASAEDASRAVEEAADASSSDEEPFDPTLLEDVDPQRWRTFHGEVQGHIDRLRAILDRASAGPCTEGLVNDALRTLHTIKSAAMVVRLEPASRRTHAIEGQVAAARGKNPGRWPREAINRYLQWLQRLPNAVEAS